MASRDWQRVAHEAERARDNAIAQLEYEQANRRRNDSEIAHERDDFIKELETGNTNLRAALVAIQKLHKPKSHVCECGENHGQYCENCQVDYPCDTRRLADDALTARTTKNGENK